MKKGGSGLGHTAAYFWASGVEGCGRGGVEGGGKSPFGVVKIRFTS